MRLAAAPQGGQEDQQVDHPDDGQPQIDVPLGLGILFGLGDAEQVAGRRQHDEQLVAADHEPGREVAGQAHPAGALDDIKRRSDQYVAAKREDHG